MNILSYLIGLAANESTAAIQQRRKESLFKQIENEEVLRKALASRRSIKDDLGAACIELARNRSEFGVTRQEEPLWRLLSDDVFQNSLVEWFKAGGISEGNAVKEHLLQVMEHALFEGGASSEQIAFLKTDYFEALDKAVFSRPMLAHWRHQLSLDYLRGQMDTLRRFAEEAAGVYSPDRQQAAIDSYCEKSLDAWDIVDLSNLPEPDIELATQKLLLRQLYMPLRITVKSAIRMEGDDDALTNLEERREIRHRREAGHLFRNELDVPRRNESRSPVGECLNASRRLVVLGDPGGGKTTLLRWMATAYLLRNKGDDAFSKMPDTQTLPDRRWIPVLIRCRDLGDEDLCRSFTDFLTQHLRKTELLPETANVMCAVILDRIARGEVLLLVDGLDEITNPQVRMMFCQELERTAARYPKASIMVTSRIVGYRDMPYRMGSDFEHGIIAELDRGDKDLFAQRWVEVTEQHQTAAEKVKRAKELLEALHSNDRIERLTGNPMLLTTLALVKRKVSKLPNRRTKLYAEAVSVLLNWNPSCYEAIEEDEAMPQLEYLAYEMCKRGVQRLTDDEVLDLLEKLRTEYPNIRVVRRREPYVFLERLEARSSILIKSGSIWQKNKTQDTRVWEFRHLTFQEYLAARALLDGRYPGRDKTKSLAEQVAPLASPVEEVKRNPKYPEPEIEVPESWRETLRLLAANCKDDDVDDVLRAILNPLAGEDANTMGRPRAVLAALCMADEPNVSGDVAQEVLFAFANYVGAQDGNGPVRTSLDAAAIELGNSIWRSDLKVCLMQQYFRRSPAARRHPGGLWVMVEVAGWERSGINFDSLVKRLQSDDRVEALSATLSVMGAAFEGKAVNVPGLTDALFVLFGKEAPESHAVAWALLWLNGGFMEHKREPVWVPSDDEVKSLIHALSLSHNEEYDLKRFLIHILGKLSREDSFVAILSKLDDPDSKLRRDVVQVLGQLGSSRAVEPLLGLLDDPDAEVQLAVVEALGQLGDSRAVEPLLGLLDDPYAEVQLAVVEALGQLGDSRAVEAIAHCLEETNGSISVEAAAALAQLNDARGTVALRRFLVDASSIKRKFVVRKLARKLNITESEVRSRYEAEVGRQ